MSQKIIGINSMFSIFSKKELIKVNMLNPEHPDGCLVAHLTVKSSIIKQYAKNNELYAMTSDLPVGQRFKHDGVIYRYWDDLGEWGKVKDKFVSIDKNCKNSSLSDLLNKTLE